MGIWFHFGIAGSSPVMLMGISDVNLGMTPTRVYSNHYVYTIPYMLFNSLLFFTTAMDYGDLTDLVGLVIS